MFFPILLKLTSFRLKYIIHKLKYNSWQIKSFSNEKFYIEAFKNEKYFDFIYSPFDVEYLKIKFS